MKDLSQRRALLLVLISLVPVAVLALGVWYLTEGNPTYTLDDPYIHLALARNIWLGNYGINLSEPSAPSSSILWPFLLSPFAALRAGFEYVPFVINLACLMITTFLLERLFADLRLPTRLGLVFIVLFSLNVYGLVFSGMEHSLQVLLIVAIMFLLLCRDRDAYGKIRVDTVLCACLVALPLIRYEGMAVSLPILCYLFFRGDSRTATMISLVFILLSVGGFSLYLHSKGLGFLPSSVIAKSSNNGVRSTFGNVASNLKRYWYLIPVVVVVTRHFWSKDRPWAYVLLATTILHLLFGKHGWYGRYEVYYLILLMIVFLRILIEVRSKYLRYYWLMPACFPFVCYATVTTPLAASNIFNQQAQMAKIATMLAEPVAVNDLGSVAFRSKSYVLDLGGLGSIDVLRARTGDYAQHNSDWMSNLTTRKGVHYVMIYDQWFPPLPVAWVRAGQLHLDERRITAAGEVVSLYATDQAAYSRFHAVLSKFAAQNSSKHFHLTVE